MLFQSHLVSTLSIAKVKRWLNITGRGGTVDKQNTLGDRNHCTQIIRIKECIFSFKIQICQLHKTLNGDLQTVIEILWSKG